MPHPDCDSVNEPPANPVVPCKEDQQDALLKELWTVLGKLAKVGVVIGLSGSPMKNDPRAKGYKMTVKLP